MYRKLTGNFEGLACAEQVEGELRYCGDRMPLVGSPLTDAEIKNVRDWILAGAYETRADAEAANK